jgi:hypothetical protein
MGNQNGSNTAIEELYQLLMKYWEIGVGIAAGAAFFWAARDKMYAAVTSSPVEGTATVILLGATIVWFVAYMHSTHIELEILRSFGVTPHVRPNNWAPTLIIMVIALLFGSLVGFVANPVVYSCVGIALIFVNSLGFSIVQRSVFLESIRGERKNPIPVPTLKYYLANPFIVHHLGIVLGFGLALILSILGPDYPNVIGQARATSSFILALTIFAEEYVLHVWRKRRGSNDIP